MQKFIDLWGKEPVVIVGLVVAVLDLAVACGAPVTDPFRTSIVGLITAIGVFIARSQVKAAG